MGKRTRPTWWIVTNQGYMLVTGSKIKAQYKTKQNKTTHLRSQCGIRKFKLGPFHTMCLEFGPSFSLWWCCYCSLLSTSKPHCNEVVPKICEEVCSIGGFRVSKEIAQHASQQGKHGNTSRDIILNHPVLSPDPLDCSNRDLNAVCRNLTRWGIH